MRLHKRKIYSNNKSFANSDQRYEDQRICKYPLLLKELIKHTPPSDAEYQDLEKALTSLSDVVGQINDHKRVTEQTREAEKLLSPVDPRDVCFLLPGHKY
jgi:hypothetical protein